MNSFILSPKTSDAAALTASGSVGGSGVANLQASRPSLSWRSTSTTPYIQGDFGAATTVDTLVLGFINAKSGDTFRLRMASTQAKLTDGTAEYDSTALTVWPAGSDLSAYNKPHRHFEFASQSLRWFRIDFDFTSNAAGYVQIGRLLLAARIEPTYAVVSGWSTGAEEVVAETLDLGGEQTPRFMGARRDVTATWRNLSQAEQSAIYHTLLERGSSRDFAVVVHPDNIVYPMHHFVIGRKKDVIQFDQTFHTSSDPASHRFSLAVTVTEMAVADMA